MKKSYLIGVAIVVIFIAAFWLLRGNDSTDSVERVSELSTDELTDEPQAVVLDFFNQWISVNSHGDGTDTQAELLTSPILSESVQTKITTALAASAGSGVDPVTCQSEVPPRLAVKVIYAEPLAAQLMILARGTEERSAFQSIVTMNVVGGQWKINDIYCAQGEVAPVKDFDFENEGFLLKNVPPPLNPDVWHLVFEQNGVMGHTLPLTFNANSLCIEASGAEAICDESRFTNATKVFLRADMTESGGIVRRLEF